MSLPTTERVFAMADIAGSSRLWNRSPEVMSSALGAHDARALAAVADHGGAIFKHTGDGFLAVFDETGPAIEAMVHYQRSLVDDPPGGTLTIRSRVCVHRGPAEHRDGDWFGPTINHLARVTDLVAPSHLVLTDSVAQHLSATTGGLEHLGTFPVRDLPEPVALYTIRLPGAVGPPLTVAAGEGLPQYRTAFVGREPDVEALLALVGRQQIVTVVGFGGMGKTRLAVEVARRWSTEQRSSAHFVDLSTTNDPLAAIAGSIGLTSSGTETGASSVDRIAKRLGASPILLVVDNCEHVIEAAAHAVDALTVAVPDLRILATSREALEIEGEARYPLHALEPPAARALLRERASMGGAGPLADDVVARLCERVDHLPLGIELVVARLHHIGADELLSSLDASIDELRARRRGREDRHATMRSLVAWSYDLLEPEEQRLLCRLARLPAPWRRSAAALGGTAGVDLLDELVAKSLVVPARAGHFRILEPVRQFCQSVLDDDPAEAAAADDALVSWGRDVVAHATDHQDPVYDTQEARALVEQAPNLRVAIDAAVARRRPGDEADILLGLWPLVVDGRARSWFGWQVDETLSRTTDPDQRRSLIRLAIQDTLGDVSDVAREQRMAELLLEADPDRTSAGWSVIEANMLVKQLVADHILGLDPEPVRERLAAAARRARARHHRLDEGVAHLFRGFSHLLAAEFDEATRHAERAAEVLRRINFLPVLALTDATVALAALGRGDARAARSIAEAACPLAERARWETSVRAVFALALARTGDLAAARSEVGEIIDLARSDRGAYVVFDAAIALGAVEAAAGDPDGAVRSLDLASVGRTPLTIAMLHATAREIAFDLGRERFVETLDPIAIGRRAERAIEYLVGVRAALDDRPPPSPMGPGAA